MPTNIKFTQLFDRMSRANDALPGSLSDALATLAQGDRLPSPWWTWFLVVLALRRRRQEWARPLVWSNLLDKIPPLEEMLEADQPLENDMPGMPEWRYVVEAEHEFGSVTHKETGEMISLDLRPRRGGLRVRARIPRVFRRHRAERGGGPAV